MNFSAPNPPASSNRNPETCRIVNYDSLGAAIKTACRLIADGVIVRKLKGSDGFMMERSDIEMEHLRRLGISRQLQTLAMSEK
jgi:hypothetical protein